MFFGETTINLDAKGRLSIPMRYREDLAEQCENRMVLTYSAFESGALWLQPEQIWERVRDDVMALPNFNADHRALQRRLVGSATAVEPDGSGRILLPPSLRQMAGLEKRVVLLGMGNRFEIWNEDTFNAKRREEETNLDANASAEMSRLVF
ncbi:MAG: division/cell wall cluster transcriptional repressor MraZ [Xanthomonadales bacterium]|nr:division/cell wall cluster transcriptional repressor MraZ [Gammaproteobacteria bacterium]MBT8074108.1 division/cell wall cluster transcriptional repressor MraZ [Gammaproteobacteria bacterium]NNK04961.1 division/cell wall cluster transcriptional repressor MraZ [Xanthomonadales bacterium]